ncbi:MAG: hemin ABC transporter substrate-binding protein [Myxococcota bacterium]
MHSLSLSIAGLALLLVGCIEPQIEAERTPQKVVESTTSTAAAPQRSIADPSRMVSLGAGVTELVYALGHGDQLVAVDASSQVPAEAKAKATLGYYRRVGAEGILAQAPTAILASEGAGPPASLEQLQTAGVAIHTLPAVVSLDDARSRIRALGELLNEADRAEQIIGSVNADLAAVQAATAERPTPSVLFIYARGGGTLMVAGTETSAQTMIEASGATLATTGHEGFRPLTSEAVVQAAPDWVLLTAGGMESMGGIDGVLAAPGLSATPAGRKRQVIAMDDNLLLDMGPRTGEAVRALAHKLHADLAL